MGKDNKKLYPEGYEHIDEKIQTTKNRIKQLDQQIKNVPQNSKPTLDLRPPGFSQPRYFNRERDIAALEQQKADLKSGTFTEIEQGVREADPKTAREVRDQAREDLFPNPFRQMDNKQANKYHNKMKDIEQSQDYMDAMFYSEKDKPKKEKETVDEKKTTTASQPSSQGSKYSLTVNFKGISGSKPTKTRDRAKDLERD